jgi:hypothetical protein
MFGSNLADGNDYTEEPHKVDAVTIANVRPQALLRYTNVTG